ncbi:MAG: GNAT family N-acetyltransferase, partial [Planctomycetota bacterium]|nr:GNAT family N-acetyltransferase [Planctomycetota bacterium]
MPLTTHYIEMRSPPAGMESTESDLLVLRATPPTVSFYRYLFESVGGPWNWVARKQISDDDLREIITDPRVDVSVAYVGGCPAGYAELDCRIAGEVEIKYFGLMPEFIGRGVGREFLSRTLRTAWSHRPNRVWLHTCTQDHPQALDFYLKAGF